MPHKKPIGATEYVESAHPLNSLLRNRRTGEVFVRGMKSGSGKVWLLSKLDNVRHLVKAQDIREHYDQPERGGVIWNY